MNRGVLFIVLFLFGLVSVSAQTRFWVANSAANWSGDNWSSTSGGAADGSGPPSGAQSAQFNANGVGNCTVDVLDPSISGLVLNGYTGIIDLNGNTITSSGTVTLSSGTINDGLGTDSLVVNSTANTTFNGTTFGAIVHITSSGIFLSGSTFNSRSTFVKNGNGGNNGDGGNIFNGQTSLTHSGAGGNWVLARTNPDDFNGDLTISNTGTGTIFMSHIAAGNTYDGNITLNGTSGISFGSSNGTSTLASGFTVSIGGSGFSAGTLLFRAFTQVGATAQNLTLTGTAILSIDESSWGGDVNFSAPRFQTEDSQYAGVSVLNKTGASGDNSNGGNRFTGNTTITNSGSANMIFGESKPDTCDANLTLNNTGTSQLFFARRSSGNLVSGSLTATNTATGGTNYLYVGDQSTSDIAITGNVILSNLGSATDGRILFPNAGDATVGGDLTITNNATGNTGNVQLASNSASVLSVAGNTVASNSGTTGTKRIYFGNEGDATFTGNMAVTNNSTATNSEVYFHHGSNSVNSYGGNIVIESTDATSDGVLFGNAGGSGTLAATRTLSIGGGGFLGTNLYVRNLTQTGATSQSLAPTGTNTLFTIYDCSWGGDVVFSSSRITTRGTVYSGTASLTKTGASDDRSQGGNNFAGNVNLSNSGSGFFLMGNTDSDTFGGDVTLLNTGTRHIYIAQNGGTNTIAGNLLVTNNGTGASNVYVSNSSTANITITGTVTLNNTGSGSNSEIYFGVDGDITLNNTLTMTNTATATTSVLSIANASASTVSITGDVSVTNTGSGNSSQANVGSAGDLSITGNLVATNGGTPTIGQLIIGNSASSTVSISGTTMITNSGSGNRRRSFLGNQGDVTFGGDISVLNSSDANESEVYFHHNTNSVNNYNGSIVLENTNASSDGILFGNSGGSGTMAATRTLSIGGGGFNGRQLYIRNLTQVGATAQTLVPAGATQMTIYDCNWGGDVVFAASRFTTRGTIYSGTAQLTKNGASDDASAGGNTFTGIATLLNSGSGNFQMGNGSPDAFVTDVTLTNTGSRYMYIANNSVGNTIGGNVVATNSGTSGDQRIYFSNNANSTLTISGTTTLNNLGSGTRSEIYLGDQGDITLNGDVTLNDASSANSNLVTVANNVNSSVVIVGNLSGTTTNSSGTMNMHVGNSGDVSISGNVILNQNSTTTSDALCTIANGDSSVVSIGGTTAITNSGSGNAKRVFLGNSGDVTFADDITVVNSSDATNSEVRFHDNANSVNAYNGNIVLEVTDATNDGVYFGNDNGSGTLAATKTISIGGGGFIGQNLVLRNFTQVGATAQTLTPTGTITFMNIYDSNWGGDIVFSSARITTRGTVYSGVTSLTKTGAGDNNSAGGNSFAGNTTLNNSGSGNFLMGNGSPDTFGGNVQINNTGTKHVHLAYNSAGNTVAGDLNASNTGTGTSYVYLSDQVASTLSITGNTVLSNTGTGADTRIYLGNAGDFTLGGDLDITNSPSGASGIVYVADDASSISSVGGNTTVLNSGASTTKQVFLGEQGEITFNGTLSITNSSSATNSLVFCNNNANSANLYNENITLEVTNASCDGIVFGNSNGTGTLAATKTITIGGGGYIAGDLTLRNFTQVGATPQSLHPTGTTRMTIQNSSWGGNIDFSSPRITSRGTTYSGTASLEKTGTTNDNSEGGNVFTGDATFTNSGSGEWRFGSNNFDTFSANVSLNNTGTNSLFFAYSGAGHSVAGNLTAINTNTTTGHIVLGNNANATLTIGGSVSLTNAGSGTNNYIYVGESGDVSITGDLIANNNATGTAGEIRLGNRTDSEVSVGGNTTVTNSGTGTTKRVYLGNQGDVTFTGNLSITNSSNATNSQVYCHHNATSVNTYSGNIVLEVTDPNNDGILFGNSAGSGTLAATRTITIGGGGFVAGNLYIRNFTQVGPTAQTLQPTGTTIFTIYDSNWGGDVIFSSPRITTRGTAYSGTALLTKNGATQDESQGGNTFTGNATLNNSGSGLFIMGRSSADVWNANLTINNTGTSGLYIADNSLGNTIAGTLTATNAGNGTSYMYMARNTNSNLTVTGVATVVNSGAGSDTRVYFGENGDITLNNDLSITNTATGTNSNLYLGGTNNSVVSVAGNTSVSNSGSGTTARIYMGNSGDVTFNGTVTATNASTANNSEIYFNHNAASSNIYTQNIIVESTNALSDGVLFGNSGGNGTLSATRTVTIGGGGFIAGSLTFRNFTQVGATAQTLAPTGTTLLVNYDSDWGGDVVFTSPRITTRGTNYAGTAILTKNGATDDASVGGNTFTGNVTLNNSGSGYFMMGNGTADAFGGNLIMNNTGSRHMYIAHNSAGNTVAGTLDVTNSGTGTSYVYLSTGGASTLTVSGATTVNNIGSGADCRAYIGDAGDINFNGDLTITNTATGSRAEVYIGDDASSAVTVTGNTIYSQSGVGSTRQCYVGNRGDITFNGNLALTNDASASNSFIYCSFRADSDNIYNGNIVLESSNASSDGIRFGQNAGTSTLGAGGVMSIGAGGFIAGDLRFRNFTQVGATAQSLTLTGTATSTLLTSSFDGALSLTSPRLTTRESTYNGTTALTKTSNGNDDSNGGNTFNGDVTFTQSGTNRFRLATNVADDYNGNVTYIKTSAGSLEPARNGTNTYAGDINFNTNTSITLAVSNGIVELDGSGPQSINDVGATAEPIFSRLTLNNTADEITLNTPITVSVQADFTAGNMITTDANLLTLNDNISILSVSDDSYVYGPVEKIGNDAFTFPVGDSGLYRPIAISAPASGSARFRARYFEQNPDPTYTYNLYSGDLGNVSSREYWILDRTNGSNSVNVTLSWNTNSGGVGDLAELRVAKWDGTEWVDGGNGGTTGNTVTGTIQSLTTFTSFSPFTLGSTTFAANPLPIELIYFDAELKDDQVELNWSTATEINNDYFVVERSVDGKTFENILELDGAGNSFERLDYRAIDMNPLEGVSYYRLKQIDFDGQFSYSDPQSVNFNRSITNKRQMLYPNPFQGGELTVNFALKRDELVSIVVTDTKGNTVANQSTSFAEGENKMKLTFNQNLAKGVYFVYVRTQNEVLESQKLIVQ